MSNVQHIQGIYTVEYTSHTQDDVSKQKITITPVGGMHYKIESITKDIEGDIVWRGSFEICPGSTEFASGNYRYEGKLSTYHGNHKYIIPEKDSYILVHGIPIVPKSYKPFSSVLKRKSDLK